MSENLIFVTESDGRTVWVNGSDDMCVGRFSARGVDVHRTAAEQMAGGSQCLDCVHSLSFDESWERFQASMLRHYGVEISDAVKPAAPLPAPLERGDEK